MGSPLRHVRTVRLPGIRRNRHLVFWAFISFAVGLYGLDAGWGQEPRRTEIRKIRLNGGRATQGRVSAIDPKGTVRVNLWQHPGFPGDHFLATKLAGRWTKPS